MAYLHLVFYGSDEGLCFGGGVFSSHDKAEEAIKQAGCEGLEVVRFLVSDPGTGEVYTQNPYRKYHNSRPYVTSTWPELIEILSMWPDEIDGCGKSLKQNKHRHSIDDTEAMMRKLQYAGLFDEVDTE